MTRLYYLRLRGNIATTDIDEALNTDRLYRKGQAVTAFLKWFSLLFKIDYSSHYLRIRHNIRILGYNILI